MKLGMLVTTNVIAERMRQDKSFDRFVNACLAKYRKENWGDALCSEDISANNWALKNNERILAAYRIPEDVHSTDLPAGTDRIWIVTEWDRSATTVLFPCEY